MLQYPLDFSIREILPFAIFCLFVFTLMVQLLYYWVIYARLAFYRDKSVPGPDKPVSVVICARNEYQKLLQNLPLILEQDYPDFEVVVVNDSSDDDSIELLESFAKDYKHLKIFNLERNLNFFQGKKFPLALGIKSAKNDLILLTDADCRPSGPHWIRNMQARYDENTEIVLGYGAYEKKFGLLNMLIRYDAFYIAIQYLSFSLSKMTYMGVGRNLSYSRQLFYRNKGFTGHYRLLSGDDDLFINKVSNRRNTRIEIDHGSHTISSVKASLGQWLFQKKRHYSTAKYYRSGIKFLLSFNYLSKLTFYLTFIILIVLKYNYFYALGALGAFILSHFVVIKFCADKLNEKDLTILSIFLELMLMVISPFVYLSNIINKTDRWS